MDKRNRPIGVFDSGLGGLTVVKKIMEHLPHENIVYFGDTARVPYGDRSKETIIKYAKSDIDFLLTHGVKAICIACNTADSMARTEMEKLYDLPIIGVVEPAAGMAARLSENRKIGVIGTKATIKSGAYETVIHSLAPDCGVISVPCPLLCPLVEEGRFLPGDVVVESVLREYLAPIKKAGADTLILGCTHYPLLYDVIEKLLPDVKLISSGFASTETLIRTLKGLDLLNPSEEPGQIGFYVSDAPERFAENGGMFIGQKISEKVEKVVV